MFFVQSLTTTVVYPETFSLLAQNFSSNLQIKKGNSALERQKKLKKSKTQDPTHLKLLKMKVDLVLSHGRFEIFAIIRKH